MAAQRARRAGDQLAAPAAQPRLELGQQVGGELRGVDREDDALHHLRGPPPRRPVGRRLDLGDRQAAERAVDGLARPRGVARARRDDHPRRPRDLRQRHAGLARGELVHGRLGPRGDAERAVGAERGEVLAEARRRGAEAGHGAEPGEDVQLGLELGQQRGEHARRRDVRGERGGQRAQHGAGERRQRRLVHGDAVGVEHRARHREAQRALGREPLRQHGDHVAAGLDPGGERLDEHVGLLGGGRLEHRVDPPLAADEALGLEPEGEDHRRCALGGPIRCLSLRVIGHNMNIVINRQALVRTPGAGTM